MGLNHVVFQCDCAGVVESLWSGQLVANGEAHCSFFCHRALAECPKRLTVWFGGPFGKGGVWTSRNACPPCV